MIMRKIFTDWRLFWPFQIVLMGLTGLMNAYLPLLFPAASLPLRIVLEWIAPLLAGAWTSFRLTRAGFIMIGAWVLPPIMHTCVPWLCVGYPPHIVSALACALVSMVAAACGHEVNRRSPV